jgi:hypothetical protein
MSKIIDYTLVVSIDNSIEFEKQVVDAIKEGWQPIGGVAVTIMTQPTDPNNTPYQAWVQAMVRYDQ